MSKQLLMYEKVIPVNKMQHGDLYVKSGRGFNFARDLNSVPLTALEFPSAAAEYAIVFTGSGADVMPAVIMGVKQGENLYVNESEGWKANYVPAFVRRYPFVFSSSDDGSRLTLCIDETFEGLNREGKGERLFDSDGEQTQYLKSVLAFLENYQSHFRHTQLFCQKLVELDLLQPMSARVKLPEGTEQSIAGFMGVDRKKLKSLDAETLTQLMSNDWLELIFLHLQSIRSFGVTIERVMPRGESEPADEEQPRTLEDVVESSDVH